MSEFNVVLAEHNGLGRVHLCQCSAVHLKVGPVTLNLAPEAFEQLAAMVQQAAARLAQIGDTRQLNGADEHCLTKNHYMN